MMSDLEKIREYFERGATVSWFDIEKMCVELLKAERASLPETIEAALLHRHYDAEVSDMVQTCALEDLLNWKAGG